MSNDHYRAQLSKLVVDHCYLPWCPVCHDRWQRNPPPDSSSACRQFRNTKDRLLRPTTWPHPVCHQQRREKREFPKKSIPLNGNAFRYATLVFPSPVVSTRSALNVNYMSVFSSPRRHYNPPSSLVPLPREYHTQTIRPSCAWD